MALGDLLVRCLRPYSFRGKARLLHGLVPRAGMRGARVFGAWMELDLSEHIQRMIYLGAYEREETRLVLGYLRPGMTVLDVGANVGYYTLAAAARVGPKGRVIAVEPSPYAADRLAATVSANAIEHVRIERLALGSRSADLPLYLPLPDNHAPSLLGDPGRASVTVPVRTLDACLPDWAVDRVDLLKLDVEGYEAEVLAGASVALSAGRIRAILCEFNDPWLQRAGRGAADLYRQLLDAGFTDRQGPVGSLAGQVVTRLLIYDR
jgi:FkbM family methyltransferase